MTGFAIAYLILSLHLRSAPKCKKEQNTEA
ncbi:hypothetical protein SAMN05444359_1352 [Neolewinella agarilytica]|uniref:Uncharacterized protein n=1 Tax=Neolewinella agarilytica TaxID=478744 RepID=A0A1H9N8G2_9BACT|nr:hypothetical protein SAMN05444359_1352 [Neolewinella agarilytica]